MPNLKKPVKSFINFFSKTTDENTLSTSSFSLTSSNGKSKDDELVIGTSSIEDYNPKECLNNVESLLGKILKLEKKIKEKFNDLDISSLETDFKNKVEFLYDVTVDFRDAVLIYSQYKNFNTYQPDSARLTKAEIEYEKYQKRFEEFNKLDKQREALSESWKKVLQEMKRKKMPKQVKQVKQIMNDLLSDAFDYLNDQDHEKFEKALEENKELHKTYVNLLKKPKEQSKNLYEFFEAFGNESKPEGEEHNDYYANLSNPIGEDARSHPTISLTTTTSVLFTTNKNIDPGKGKEREVKRASFSF